MKIFDCTTFNNANFLFETRFNVLNKHVDYFVVCEANRTHTGNPKNFNFNPKIPEKYKHKIIYIKIEDLPKLKLRGEKDYALIEMQIENLFSGIKLANSEDLIIYSDEDEIPNPEKILDFQSHKFKFGIFMQNMYYYKINLLCENEGNGNWPGPRICKKKYLKSFFKLRMLKVKNTGYPFWRVDKEKSIELIKEGGWHFSYLMSPEEIAHKIQNAGHTELNKPQFRSIEAIKNNIKNLKDPFNRNLKFRKTIIDQSYPQYIINNLDLFSDWIEK